LHVDAADGGPRWPPHGGDVREIANKLILNGSSRKTILRLPCEHVRQYAAPVGGGIGWVVAARPAVKANCIVGGDCQPVIVQCGAGSKALAIPADEQSPMPSLPNIWGLNARAERSREDGALLFASAWKDSCGMRVS
jgi:hypothetical protein